MTPRRLAEQLEEPDNFERVKANLDRAVFASLAASTSDVARRVREDLAAYS